MDVGERRPPLGGPLRLAGPGGGPRGREALLAAAVAIPVGVVPWLVADASGVHRLDGPRFGILAPAWVVAMLALVVGGYLARRRPLVVGALCGVVAAVETMPMAAGLFGTAQPLNTILNGDQSFRTEYVTRFADSALLHDYTFKGLHAFYPPAWFWLTGRAAAVSGVRAWTLMKPATLCTEAVVVVAAYLLWRSAAVPPAAALAATVGALLLLGEMHAGAPPAWYSPYSAAVAVLGAPWAVWFALTATGDTSTRRRALVAVVGAVLALTYYLTFLVVVVAALLTLARRAATDRRVLAATAQIVVGIAVLTAVFWVPALVDVLRGSATQGHYLGSVLRQIHTGLGDLPWFTLVTVIGAAGLLLSVRSLVSRCVLSVAVVAVGYQVLSVVLTATSGQQLQPQRAATLLAATIGSMLPVALSSVDVDVVSLRGLRVPGARLAALALAVVAPAYVAIGDSQAADLRSGPLTHAAHRAPALGYVGEVTRFITSVTHDAPDRLVVASESRAVLVTEPFYGFLPWNDYYAHPDARLAARRAILARAAACTTARCLDATVTRTGLADIDAFVMRSASGRLSVDGVSFQPLVFDAATWARRDIAGWTVIVRRPV